MLTVPLLPVFAALIGATTRDATQRRWRALASLSGHFLDVMRGLPTLVSYGRAARQVDSISAVSQRHRRTTMETLRLAFLSSAALELLATISVAMVAVTVGIRLAHGSMALGTALVAILLAPEAYWPIRRVGAEFHAAADGAEALADIQGHLAAPGATAPPPSAPPPAPAAVRAESVSYTYPGTHHAGAGRRLAERGTGPHGRSPAPPARARRRCSRCSPAYGSRGRARSPRPAPTSWASGRSSPPTACGKTSPWGTAPDPTPCGRRCARSASTASSPRCPRASTPGSATTASASLRASGPGSSLARAVLSPATVVLLDEPTAHLDAGSVDVAHEAIRTLADPAVRHRRDPPARARRHGRQPRAPRPGPHPGGDAVNAPKRSPLLRPTGRIVAAGLLGGAALSAGVALTATSAGSSCAPASGR